MGFVRPEEVVKEFKLEPGMVVADFGSGSGHYTIACAEIVGSGGKVYAIDVQKDLLESVKNTADMNNLNNVEIIWGDLETSGGSRLADGSVDFVVVSNILFQAEDREAVAKETSRVLKKNGRVAVIEWAAKGEPRQGRESSLMDIGVGKGFGPAPDKRISKEEAQTLFIQNGFKLKREIQPGENHYGLIFVKSDAR